MTSYFHFLVLLPSTWGNAMPLVGFQEEVCNIFTAIIQLRHCCCGEMMCYGENDSLVLCSPHVSWSKTTLARSDTPVLTLLSRLSFHRSIELLWGTSPQTYTPARYTQGKQKHTPIPFHRSLINAASKVHRDVAECREHKQLSNLPVYWESTHKTPANLVRGRGTTVRSLFWPFLRGFGHQSMKVHTLVRL